LVRSGADPNEIGGSVSPATFQLTVQQQPQTITFNQPDPKTYGVADFDPGATASSGLAVSYSSSTPGVCTIVSGKVHVVSAGDCKVTASQAGNANYSAAPSVERTIVINKAPLTVVTDNKTKKFGEDNPPLTGSVDGLQYNDNITATYSTTATQNSDVGDYPITATLTDTASKLGNYTVTNNGGTLTINKADATIDVQGYTGVYDGDPHGATGSATGVGGANLNSQLDLGATFTDAPGGTAHWTFNGGTNYNDDEGDAQITINKADADIQVNGYTGTYDGDPHGASGTATGVGGANLNSQLNLGATFTDAPGGTAHWTFNGGTNYNDDEGDVQITINKVELTVTADNQSKTYDKNPFTAFTRTITGFVNSEDDSVVSGTVTYGGTAVGALNASTYTIIPDVSGLSATNYTFTPANGTLTINQRPITVTADAKSKLFNDPDPPLTYQVTSQLSPALVGTDTFTGALTRVQGELVGQYDILQGNVSAGPNYKITYVGAKLTIGAWNAQGKGFYAPVGVDNSIFVAAPGTPPAVNGTGTWNTVKGGSTVPLKFNVFAGTVEKTSLADIKGLTAQKLNACSTSGTADLDPVDFTTTETTSLRYDTTAKQWIQNWKTPKVTSESCYRATVTFADGSSISAFFRLLK
jgi:hypothetical protein